MNIDKAINVLEQHQEWRLGDNEVIQTNARELTESIITILSEVKKLHLQNISKRSELLKVLDYARHVRNNPKDIQLLIDKMYLETFNCC